MNEWQQPYIDRAAQLSAELSGIVDTMNELVVDHLREASENGYQGRPQLDKSIQAARRAIEKAARLLAD